MPSKDIEKLKERVDKDPNSKLFVPLAEEYRKEGLVEEAIRVLQEGLERQPNYMSARVALGKMYLEKGMAEEAQGEFENVIKAIPDNLYAHKKLADIYKESGKRDLAIKSYRTVLKLNSMDEDALHSLHELEESAPEDERGQEVVTAEVAEEAPFGFGEADAGEYEMTNAAYDTQETPASAYSEGELDAFKDSLFGEKGEGTEEEVVSLAEEADEGLWEQGADDTAADTAADDSSPAPASQEAPSEQDKGEQGAEGGTTGGGEISDIGRAQGPSEVPGIPAGSGDRSEGRGPHAVADADGMIARGDYAGAIGVYQNILADNPGDIKVMQRMEELRSFLKMTGKDKDAVISRLNTFLEGVKRRRDGFFGSS